MTMKLIRWIRQQVKQIKNCWIITKIWKLVVFRDISKKSETHNQREKKRFYKDPELKKWKNFRRG